MLRSCASSGSIITCVVAMAWLAALRQASAQTPASFHQISAGTAWTDVYGVSGDGLVVVGSARTPGPNPTEHAFKWTQASGPVLLAPGALFSRALAANGDGSVIVGMMGSPSSNPDAFRWTQAGGIVNLSSQTHIAAYARAVSPDGQVVVGQYAGPVGESPEAARWVGSATVPQRLGAIPPAIVSDAYGVSADGSVVVGGVLAFRWAGSMAPLGANLQYAFATSADGNVIVGRTMQGEAFRLDNGAFTALAPGPFSEALDVSADGSVVVGRANNSAFIWTADTGTQDLRQYLETECGLNMTGWVLAKATGVSDDGRVIVGNTPAPGVGWMAILPDDDTDGDGLLDSWETVGVPYIDIHGDVQHYVLDGPDPGTESDADPQHKDLFVELDMLNGLTFPQDSIDAVVAAFDFAPLLNPDGTQGIRLHIIVDDANLPFEPVTNTPNANWPPTAPQLKADWFGTASERGHASAEFLLDAKAQAYRYGIQFNRASEAIGGLGEMPGDDFVIFAGGYSNIDKAAVFMHELGHNLGLDHGGGDDINGKPNYPSIMNYVIAYREPWNASFWRLDYSRAQLTTLDESNLDETQQVGNSFYYDHFMPFHSVVPIGASCFDPALWGLPLTSYVSLDVNATTDYDLDCDSNDQGVVEDLNFLAGAGLPGMVTPSPGEPMPGWNDWAHVVLPISDGGGAFAGPAPSNELTEDQVQYMSVNFPIPPGACPLDIEPADGDDQVDINDLLAVINVWGPCENIAICPADIAPAVGDGAVNINDLLAVINAWGPCP